MMGLLHPVTKGLDVLLWIVLVPAALACLLLGGCLAAAELGIVAGPD